LPRIYEKIRKVRRVKTAKGKGVEYIFGLPKEWVEAVAREKNISLDEAALHLKIRYDGKLEALPITPKEAKAR